MQDRKGQFAFRSDSPDLVRRLTVARGYRDQSQLGMAVAEPIEVVVIPHAVRADARPEHDDAAPLPAENIGKGTLAFAGNQRQSEVGKSQTDLLLLTNRGCYGHKTLDCNACVPGGLIIEKY